MRFQNIVFIFMIAVTFAGCNSCGEVPKKTDSNTNKTNPVAPPPSFEKPINKVDETNQNLNVKPEKGNKLEEDVKTVDKPTTQVEAVTLKPLVEAYCNALRKKDDEALKKLYSQRSLREMYAEMKNEGYSTLSEYLELEDPGNKCQVVNETIKGGTAEAYVITESYPTGTAFTFEQENGEWKMTNRSPEVDRVDKN